MGTSTSGTGVSGISASGDGVDGSGGTNGVHGVSTSSNSTSNGVLGEAQSAGTGVSGISMQGVGVYGKGATLAAQFDGAVTLNGTLSANGVLNAGGVINAASNIVVTGDVILSGSDCAEEFEASTDNVGPGSVVVLDDDGALRQGETPYDKRVAGVISGAGKFKPAMIMGRTAEVSLNRMPLALTGRVYCKVDASYNPIRVGDLLTTSSTPGHAMKASDPSLAFGAVIGKAMAHLDRGQGLIPVLVALQ